MAAVITVGTEVGKFLWEHKSEIESIWNNLWKGEDTRQLWRLVEWCGGDSLYDILGLKICAAGSSGLGSYPCTIIDINLAESWLNVLWQDGSGEKWKTAKLCMRENWDKGDNFRGNQDRDSNIKYADGADKLKELKKK
jgi:hypothetical protein